MWPLQKLVSLFLKSYNREWLFKGGDEQSEGTVRAINYLFYGKNLAFALKSIHLKTVGNLSFPVKPHGPIPIICSPARKQRRYYKWATNDNPNNPFSSCWAVFHFFLEEREGQLPDGPALRPAPVSPTEKLLVWRAFRNAEKCLWWQCVTR